MTAHTPLSVASGKPYPVTEPPAGHPVSLDLFVGDAEFTIDGGGNPLLIRGHGVPLEDKVRFQEKDTIGGKDVRVWHVSQQGDGFVAETVAAF
jgi:hypothetical protein